MAGGSENDFVDPYDAHDPKNEPHPDSVVYQPIFTNMRTKCREVADALRDPLMRSPFQNAVTQGLLEDINYRTKERFADSIMFALSGDMAAGKSSVNNSILSTGTIARKGTPGDSCTWVVQRFMKMFPEQNSPYAAKIHFFDSRQIRDIIKSHFVKYFHASAKDDDGSDEPDTKNGVAVEDFNDIRTVLDAFIPLFCDQPEFDTEEHATKFLGSCESEDDQEKLEILFHYAERLLSLHLDGNEVVYVPASTPEDLLFKLQPYTYTLGPRDIQTFPSPWPLVRLIDFGMDNRLLNDGFIFVDAPGRTDANSTRASNALAYHRECNHKIDVAEVGRAIAEKSIPEEAASQYRLRGSGHYLLVLTRGDDIDEETDVFGSGLAKKREQMLKDEVKSLGSERSKLNVKRQRTRGDERDDLDAEFEAVKDEIQAKKRELKVCRLSMRNEDAREEVQKHYKKLTGDPRPLSVHVVGNEAYKHHQAGFYEEGRPIQTVEQTGIPGLRRRIYLLPADGRLNDAVHLALVQLPNLINSIELYCSKTHMDRASEIEAIVLRPKEQARQVLASFHNKLLVEAKKSVLRTMMTDESTWVNGARKLCQRWAVTYERIHLTMLKKNGFKKGIKKKGEKDVSWNAELLMINKSEMLDYFENLQKALEPAFDAVFKDMVDMLVETTKDIRNDRQSKIMALEPFLKSFALERPNALNNILEDATSTTADCYLAKAMEPIYSEVRQIKGRGAPPKRIMLFEQRVTQMSDVWLKVNESIKEAFVQAVRCELEELESKLEDIFDGIHRKFGIMCETIVPKTEEEKVMQEKLREELRETLDKVCPIVNGAIHEAALECKNWSTNREESALFVSSD